MNKEALLKKLLKLSEQGIGGEKENAEALLNKLLKKYEINIEDISEEEKPKQRDIWYENDYELRLLNQLYYAWFPKRDSWNYTNKRYKKARHTMILELTDAELIQFEYAYEILKENWYKEVDLFYHAFIQKNNIFPKEEDALDLPSDNKKVDMKDLIKMESYARGIDTVAIRQAIE